VDEKAAIYVLYKKLLNLYPRRFRERLGKSMEQTFEDLYRERRTRPAWVGFFLWTFTETGIGIFREYVLLIAEGAAMRSMLTSPRVAPLLSFILCVLPFMILEWVTQSDAPRSDASPMLWVVLWFLSTGFIAIMMLIVRGVRAGDILLTKPLVLLLRVVCLAIFAWLWGALVIDQMPCFLGGSGC
jgi:hypothetical protein